MTTSSTNEWQTLRLSAIRYAARGTSLFELSHPEGGTLPAVTAGAHIDVLLPNDIMRQYSLLHAGSDLRSYTLGVKRDPVSRGGSSYMHDSLRVGQIVKASRPRNNFPLNEDARYSVMIAGGIGITPVWCMIQRLAELGRSWELHYSSRCREDAALLDTLQEYGHVHFNFDEENERRYLDLATIVAAASPDAHFYCCGPQQMLKAFEAATQGLAAERVHLEYFASRHKAAVDGGYMVELARSGQTYEIPKGSTILNILRDAGVPVNFSCEHGTCGACETNVLGGIPDHRDSLLSEQERAVNNTMMICCSGCKGDRLVLDL
ncbi:PDR/VanB family oxidoreductase [Bradyrhizobium sp. 14AA]